jgi:antitoxin ParD1/3/4
MTSLTITLPDRARAYIEAQIASGHYQNADDLVTALINQAADSTDNLENDPHGPEHLQVRSIDHLQELLQAGLDSGDPIEVTDEWWETRRQSLLSKIRTNR